MSYTFLAKFGSVGTGNGQFNRPFDCAVDDNYIYVVDNNNYRVQIFNKITYAYINQFGSHGTGDGQFNEPEGIAVDNDYIYVSDNSGSAHQANVRIQIFNKTTYAFVNKFGSYGTGNGQFTFPTSIAIDASYIYVVDNSNSRIQIFNKSTYAFVDKFGSYGSGNGQFTFPWYLKVDNNYIYVTNPEIYLLTSGNRVQVFDKSTYAFVAKLTGFTHNTEEDEFGLGQSTGIALDDNYIYISDQNYSIIEKFNKNTYDYIETIGSVGSGDGQFDSPIGIEILSDKLYIADFYNNRVQIFSSSNNSIRISQCYIEVLNKALPAVIVSQCYIEVLNKALPAVIVSQCYIEVLRQKKIFAIITQTYVEVLILPLTVYSIISKSRIPINFTRGIVYYNEINNSLLYSEPSSLNSPNYIINQGSKVITSANSILETDVPNLKKRILYDRLLIKTTISTSDNASVGTVAYCSINQIDLSTKDALVLYIRSSRDTSVGDLALILDNSNTFSSILETLYIPSLVTNTWHRVLLRLNNPYDDTAINTIGIQLLNNLGTFTLDIAEIRSVKELNGFRSFTIENNVDELEESDYLSKGSREYNYGNYFWTATIEGHKEEKPPFKMKTSYVLAFSESNAIGDAFVGDGNYSGFDVVGRMDDLVRYNYKLQGTLPIFFPQKNAIILQAPEPVL